MSWKHFWRANNKKNDWTWKKEERTKERRKNERKKKERKKEERNTMRDSNKQTQKEKYKRTEERKRFNFFFVMHSFSITCQTTKVEV
jgi:hypothetical protein